MTLPATEGAPVLVVDDDELLARTIADILVMHGFAPRTASTGHTALALAREISPSLAVVDLRLPDMDGLDLASRLHAHSGAMQVIILTGNASIDTAIRALRDEHCDYLVKPVEPAALIKTLRAADGRWRLRNAEEALRNTQQVLRAVFDASPLPMVTLDTDLRVTLWNQAAEQVFGWRADEVIGHPPPFEDEGDRASALARRRMGLLDETILGAHIKRSRRDGTGLDLRASSAPLTDASDNVTGLFYVYEDITERLKIDAHLRDAQRLDQIGRLAGGVAHDFNNLLAVIMAETDMALGEAGLAPAHRETLENVNKVAAAGAALTKQLLAFARRQKVERKIVSLNDLVADFERMLLRVIGDHIKLETRLAADLWQVSADKGQLEQVLANLVVNARDAMPSGGTVTVTTSNFVAPQGTTTPALEGREWVLLSVRDTGTGIPADILGRIFEPFFTTKERGQGTGLGLATCYGIVQQFGGVLTVESVVGQGSTFLVHLPRASRDRVSPIFTEAVRAPSGTEHVLIVEDHAMLRAAARRILQRQGYSVSEAPTAAEADRVIAEFGRVPDIVVVDANLPDGDGRDYIQRLRAAHPGARVMLTSGSSEFSTEATPGVVFLAKPYTPDGLSRAVRRVLDTTGGS